MSPMPMTTIANDPKPELLRRHGWNVKAIYGEYCVVWRGAEEIVMVWRNGEWERAGGGALNDAA